MYNRHRILFLASNSILIAATLLLWQTSCRRPNEKTVETPWGPANISVLDDPLLRWSVIWTDDQSNRLEAEADKLILGLPEDVEQEVAAEMLEDWAARRGLQLGTIDVRRLVGNEYLVELITQRDLALSGHENKAISTFEVLAALEDTSRPFGVDPIYLAPKLRASPYYRPKAFPCKKSVQWANEYIGAKDWWGYVKQPRRSVLVAVLDMGLETHGDLESGDLLFNRGSSVVKSKVKDPPTFHTVALIGIIAGRHDSDDLVDGVSPKTKFVPIRISDDEYSSVGYFREGLRRVLDKLPDAEVILTAASFSADKNVCGEFQEEMKKLNEHGTVVVASIPNNSNAPKYPAACQFQNLIVVGAVDEDGDYRSAQRELVQLVAPGDNVCVLRPGKTSSTSSWYKSSSAAAAFTAGAIALVLSANKKGDMSALDVLKRLKEKAKLVGDPPLPALCLEGLDLDSKVKCHWPKATKS